jgi:lysophospholipase L1-like esterase
MDTSPVRRVFITGDSTAAPKAVDARAETGWGMALPFYLSPRLTVENHARNGRSSKSFVDEGRLEPILAAIRPDDVLVVQFGHNDTKSEDPLRYTEPWSTYRQHLAVYVSAAQDRGAVPVLATPAERRGFDGEGKAVTSHGEYPDAMRALATELDVPLVDVQRATLDLWQQLGPDGSRACFDRDNTHFSPRGAGAVAAIVANGLVDAGVLHTDDVRRLDEVPQESWFTWLPEPPA